MRGNVRARARQRETNDTLATTTISAAELYYGAAKARDPIVERDRVGVYLRSIRMLTLDTEAARIFGDTKALLEREGQRLPDADLLIASICLAHGATLVTGNRRHLDRIPGLSIEDWIHG